MPTRSVLDLAVTVGNVTGDVGTSDPQLTGGAPLPGYNLQANGGRAGSTNMLADGINNTGVGLAREAVSFSPETAQEFTVQTNGFDAQYGKSGGSIISITTKSGTNDFSGLALWYIRNPAANAAPFTQARVNRPVNRQRWNQFNGQLGGPGHDSESVQRPGQNFLLLCCRTTLPERQATASGGRPHRCHARWRLQ